MDKNLGATHEAGHAVVQWLVGWEVRGLKMKVEGTNATEVEAVCPWHTVKTLSEVRRRLLVLLAGNAATWKVWPGIYNNAGDWNDLRNAVSCHFVGRTLHRDLSDAKPYLEDDVNELIESARQRSKEVVEHSLIRTAIDQLAELFVNAEADSEGNVWLPGAEAIKLCETVIGKEFQAENPWSGWLAGE